MEIDAVDGWQGRVPPWLAAVVEGDLLGVADVDELPVWDDVEVAALLTAGLGPELPQVTPASVAELLDQVASMPPGGAAFSALASLADRDLTADERLTVVQLWQPLLAWAAGAETSAWLAFAGPKLPTDTQPDLDTAAYDRFTTAELAAAELGPALGTTVGFAASRIATARLLGPGGRFARVGDLLRSGQLSDYKTRLLLEELELFEPPIADAVQDVVLGTAGGPGRAGELGPTALKRLVRRTGKRLLGKRNPDAVLASFVAAQRTRRVWFDAETVDGLVFLGAHLPPVEALAIHQLLQRDAGGRDCFDGRSHDEREADALMARILGGQPHPDTSNAGSASRAPVPVPPKIQLNVLVPLSTLLGGNDHPGELDGFGDLPPAIIRSLAGDAAWQRWLYADADGHLLDLGKHRYHPTPELDRLVRARDPQCRFPYSTQSSARQDLDHHEEFDTTGNGQGGPTSADNLGPLSRFPHRLKTHGGHRIKALRNGIRDWTTPLGRTYRLRAHDYRPHPATTSDDDEPPPLAGR